MKNIIIVILSVAISSLHISAQGVAHEYSIYGSTGLSTISYKLSSGDRSGGFGGDFGIGYTIFFNASGGAVYQLGLHTGIGLGIYNATTKVDGITFVTPGLVDNDTHLDMKYRKFDLHTTLSDYEEKQTITSLIIPIMAMFTVDRFYAFGGFKFGFPLGSKFQTEGATLTNVAHYTEIDNWARVQSLSGYGPFNDKDVSGTMEIGVSTLLSFEGGMLFRLSNSFLLYTGVFFDYGLNNVSQGDNYFINYDTNSPTDFSTNSVLSVDTQKVKPMAVGVKLRLAMGSGR